MKYISLFSGIEAASCAWGPLGWDPVAFSEIDPFCCAVLNAHYPNVLNLGDINKIDWSTYEQAVDVVVGGSPCQAFSIAGNRAGLLDERGRLMLEYIRAVQNIRPTWCVWENVPGVLSQDQGRAFATLLSELEKCGYSLAWRVLDAQYFGVAQRRRRVFLVGHSRVGCAAAVLFERESLCGNNQTNPRQWAQTAKNVGTSAKSTAGCVTNTNKPITEGYSTSSQKNMGYKETYQAVAFMQNGNNETYICGDGTRTNALCADFGVKQQNYICLTGDQGNAMISDEVCGTLTSAHDGVSVCMDSLIRRLTPVECERLQRFPDNWTNVEYNGKAAPNTQRYRALGNSMAVPVMVWLGKQINCVQELIC